MEHVPAIFQQRRAGVLLHLTSLPGPHGVGDLGPASDRFAQWCADSGLSLWQMLPIGPVGYGESPYSATSSFAAEPMLVSLERLVQDGLLPVGVALQGRGRQRSLSRHEPDRVGSKRLEDGGGWGSSAVAQRRGRAGRGDGVTAPAIRQLARKDDGSFASA